MVFADLFFLYFFLPVCLIFYFMTRNLHIRNAVLIVFSLVFYAWGEPVWVSLLIISSVIDYINGLVIDKFRGRPLAKLAVIWSLIANLGLLVTFKYSGFIMENVNALCKTSFPVPKISLPIGISFYTFQTISYTIDCYRNKVKTQKNFFKFLMYVSLFPQLVAGPIVRYSTIGEEIENRRTTVQDFSEGISRIILGIGKKVLIANAMSGVVTSLFGESSNDFSPVATVSVSGAWLGAAAVALWYYFDFSGYSDIAIGLGRIFGFHFDENFNYPFICTSITDFWRRWHISLGSWFRDYVYIPMGGNRCSKARNFFNIMVVWGLTGFWHGASWNFVLWGLYFGVFLLVEKYIGKERINACPRVISHIYTKIIIAAGFALLHIDKTASVWEYFRALVGANSNPLADHLTKTVFTSNIYILAIAVLFSMPVVPKLKEILMKQKGSAVLAQSAGVICNLGILALSSIMLVNNTNNPFLYFRF